MITWGHTGIEVKNRGVLRSWKGSIQAKSNPEENLDQLKVCWQSPKLNENHLAYEKRLRTIVLRKKLVFWYFLG